MEKTVKLKNGTPVLIRNMKEEDGEKSWKFFCDLPEEDRRYLRIDVTQRDLVEKRVQDISSGEVHRLVACVDEMIVGDGALELNPPGWMGDVAELRLIVSKSFQGQGLGMLMAAEIFQLAVREKVKRLMARILKPQVAARKILTKLGFKHEQVIPALGRDLKGERQDMVVMSSEIEKLLKKMESILEEGDWQRTR